MFNLSCPVLLHTALSAMAVSALAQTAPSTPSRPDPLNASTAVPAATYTSSLSGYRRQRDDAPVDWRKANDTTRQIGGWRTFAREAQDRSPAPAAPASTAASAASAAAPAPAAASAATSGHDAHRSP